MYRIDNATAVAALPTPEEVGPNPDGYFTKGDPGAGIPATIVDDDWANAVQEELIAIVEAGGLTPSKTVLTQVRDAINLLIAANVAPDASETVKGIVELATDAEAQSFTANKFIDGAKLNTAFKGANQSLAASGYQKLPGGLILQWLNIAPTTSAYANFALPIAFPNALLTAAVAQNQSGVTNYQLCINFSASSVSNLNAASVNTAANNYVPNAGAGSRVIVIGY